MERNSKSDIKYNISDLLLYQFPAGLGADALKIISSSKILILGLNGLGAEIAKNLVLSGAPLIALRDKKSIQGDDLATSFLLHEEDIGQNRAEVYSRRLKEFREYAQVSVHDSDLNETNIKQFDLICMTEADSVQHLTATNNMCRTQGVPFIFGEVFGAFGCIFNDFGDSWQTTDLYAQTPQQCVIESMQGTASELSVDLHIDDDCYIQPGTRVVLRDLPNFPQLNNRHYTVLSRTHKYNLKLGSFDDNTSEPVQYTYGGYVEELPVAKTFQFRPFSTLTAGDIDFDKHVLMNVLDYEKIPHWRALVLALLRFKEKHSRLPRPWNEQDANEVLTEVEEGLRSDKSRMELNTVRQLANVSGCHLAPVTTIFGGIIAHEIIKCVTHKGTPIDQFMLYDAARCLPANADVTNVPLTGFARVDALVNIFGYELACKIQSANVLLLGAGSIGNELLKTLGLMGVATRDQGQINVMDRSAVHLFHVPTHSLCRAENTEDFKAKVAVEAVQKLHAKINAKYLVGDSIKNDIDDARWKSTDLVFNVVGSLEPRKEADDKAVFFRKPIVDCGITDASGHSFDCVPFIAEPSNTKYFAAKSAPGKWTFPCTPQHCIAFALDMFERHFLRCPDTARTGTWPPHEQALEDMARCFLKAPKDFVDCVKWARKQFEKTCRRNILQLMHNFPADYVDTSGKKFWAGIKRPPVPVTFDTDNDVHVAFIESAAILTADMFQISLSEFNNLDAASRRSFLQNILQELTFPEFVPRKMLSEQDQLAKEAKLAARMPKERPDKLPVSVKFDKYNERHVSYVHSLAVLRAQIFRLPNIERGQARTLAGNIVPKIISTASTLAGLACLEFIKIQLGYTSPEQLRNNNVNLNAAFFQESEPVAPLIRKYCGKTFTAWDPIEIRDSRMTLQGLLDYMKTQGIDIELIGAGNALLYASFRPIAGKLEKRLSEIMRDRGILANDPEYQILEVYGIDVVTGEDLEDVPQIVFYLKDANALSCSM